MPSLDSVKSSRRKQYAMSVYGYIEIDLKTGKIIWQNPLMSKYSAKGGFELLETSIYSYIHPDFLSNLTDCFHKLSHGQSIRKSMWPTPHKDTIVWWSATVDYVFEETIWIQCDPMHTTKPKTPEFKLACMIAECRLTISEVEIGLSEVTSSLQVDVKDIKRNMKDVESDLETAAEAAKLSAEASRANRESTEKLREEMASQFIAYTQEIAKLISSDVVHDRRLKIFEEAVEKRTREAIEKIDSRVSDSNSPGIASKLVLPVGTATAITTLIQYIIDHFLK